jgi:hypothetical protein
LDAVVDVQLGDERACPVFDEKIRLQMYGKVLCQQCRTKDERRTPRGVRRFALVFVSFNQFSQL